MNKKIIIEIISSLLVFLFLYTSISKLSDYSYFREQLLVSPALSPYGKWLSWMVPGAELVIIVLLIIPSLRLFGLYASFFLMLLFTAYVFYILTFSSQLPCNCGGVLEEMNWQQHFLFNIFFSTLSFIGVRLEKKQTKYRQMAKAPTLLQ